LEGHPPGLTWRHERVELPREQELQEFLMDRVAEGGGGPKIRPPRSMQNPLAKFLWIPEVVPCAKYVQVFKAARKIFFEFF
jgi:hypothetical protein